MIRRLNYTGRVKIRRADIQLKLNEGDGPLSFNAILDLDSYEFDSDALVFVEVYRQTTWMRFPFGTVSELKPPTNCLLTEFDSPEAIHFRVKVTQAHDTHTLLGEADAIPLGDVQQQAAERDSLISTKPENLGDELWRLDFEHGPLLLVSNQVGNWQKLAQSAEFAALVYPAMLREILTRILIQEEHRDTEDVDSWMSRWLRFATELPGVDDLLPPKDKLAAEDWIQDVVSAFGKQLKLREKFLVVWEDDK